MATLETLDEKLTCLGGEMRTQTEQLRNIEANTKQMVVVATQDQEARDRIYDRLAEGFLKLARVLGIGFFCLVFLALIATFKQELHGAYQGSSIHIGTQESIIAGKAP